MKQGRLRGPSSIGEPPRSRDQSLEQALAAAGDGAFAVGPDGRVFLWNRAAERILGWTAREVVEKPCCEVLRGSTRTATGSAIRAAM